MGKPRSLGLLVLAGFAVAGVGCGGKGDSPANPPAPVTPEHHWTEIGPPGGWFPAAVYDPGVANQVWMSGDDGSGLYRSSDGGATFAQVPMSAVNESAYVIRFDPTVSTKIFAPNHFGRGMLTSTDDGVTWNASQAGLPILGNNNELLNDVAINPTAPANVLVGTNTALYLSTDGGQSFSLRTTTLTGTAEITALAFRSDGVLFLGRSDGTLGASPDNGASWSTLLASGSPAIAALAFSATSIYIAYANGALYQHDKTSLMGEGGLINDPSAGSGTAQNGDKLSLAVKSGAGYTTDVILLGTMGSPTVAAARTGIFISTNGGTSWAHPGAAQGIPGYVMSVAIDPNNSNQMVAGSGSGYGIFHSTDGGTSWSLVQTRLYGTPTLGAAQDPAASAHLAASATACAGYSAEWESTNAGATWARIADPVANDGVFSFDFAPSGSGALLAGTCTQGIYRSANGSAGPWTQVTASPTQYVDRFVHDRVSPSLTYAVVPQGDSTHSLYVSTNEGAAFTPVAGVTAWSLAAHPAHAGEAIITSGGDAFASDDSFITSHSLGATGPAAAQGGLSAVAFNPASPSEVLLGGGSGGVYRSENYVPTGAGVTWTPLSTPITAAPIRDLAIVSRSGHLVYYATTSGGQTGFSASSTVGVFRSLDGGATWTSITEGLFPSTQTWHFFPDESAPTTAFLLGMWEGGMFRLVDTE